MLKDGREIVAEILSEDFHNLSACFEGKNELSFDTHTEALEFLTCYLVLFTTREYLNCDKEETLHKIQCNYHRIRSILKKRKKLLDKEILLTTYKNRWFYLQGKMCFWIQD